MAGVHVCAADIVNMQCGVRGVCGYSTSEKENTHPLQNLGEDTKGKGDFSDGRGSGVVAVLPLKELKGKCVFRVCPFLPAILFFKRNTEESQAGGMARL